MTKRWESVHYAQPVATHWGALVDGGARWPFVDLIAGVRGTNDVALVPSSVNDDNNERAGDVHERDELEVGGLI